MRTQVFSPMLLPNLVAALPEPSGLLCFRPSGMLAVHPSAIGAMFQPQEGPPNLVTGSPVAVVTIRGPLLHHTGGGFDSYDGIKARVKAALEAPNTQKVLLSIDSPGGLVDGCLDTVSEIRALAEHYGKPIYSYVDGTAVSAAYALCLIGTQIFVPPTGSVGSIGVIQTLVDSTVQDQALGLRYHVIYSGARKSDTNSHIPKDDLTLQALQSEVDYLAGIFFDVVSTYRAGISSDQVRSLQAGVLTGAQAISAGLADQLATEDQVVTLLSNPSFETQSVSQTQGNKPMASFSDAMAALQAVIDDPKAPDEDKEKAKKAISACSSFTPKAEGETPAPEPDGDEPKKDEAKAEAAPEPDGDEPKDADKKALRVLSNKVTDLERTALLATRQDLTAAHLATLRKAPLSVVKDAVETWPQASVEGQPTAVGPIAANLAALGVQGTRGDVQPTTPTAPTGGMSDHEQKLLAQIKPVHAPKGPFIDSEGFYRTPSLTADVQKRFTGR